MRALYVEVQIIGHVIVPLHIQKAVVQDLQANGLKDRGHVQDLGLEVVHQEAENTGQDQEIDLEIERNGLAQNQNLLPGQDLDQDPKTRNAKNLLNLQNEKAKREKGKGKEKETDPNLQRLMIRKVATKKIKKAKILTMKKKEMEKINTNLDQDLHLLILLQIRNNRMLLLAALNI